MGTRSPRKTRSTVTRLALALCAGGALVTVGCVSKADLVNAEQQLDLCAKRYEQLQTQVEEADRTRRSLSEEKSVLQAKVTTLQTQEQVLGSVLREREQEAAKLQDTYDGLVANLKKEVQAGQITVKQLRDGLRVNVSQDILFDSGSAALDKNGLEVLGRVALQLKKSPHQIMVIGHTDDRPIGPALIKQYPTNWELAGARAASVVRLFNTSGILGNRLLVVSMADVQPVASNTTAEGRARNRRIEIRLRPVPAAE
jgi:chemotaxis protein MotB